MTIRVLPFVLVLVACARSYTAHADSEHAKDTDPRIVAGLPADARRMLDSIQQLIREDSSSPAFKQLNRSSIDVSPSPDWRRLAYTSSIRLPTDSTRWENAMLSFADARRVAERGADGSLWVRFAVVEPDPEGCMGNGCKTPLVSPVHGGSRIAWTANSRYLLLGRRDDSLNWTVIDPRSRQAVAVEGQTPHRFVWQTRAVATASNPQLAHDVTGGSYRFTTRGDSILVRGPDRNGQITDRIVGAGVPVAVTRNGQYLLAVRPEGGRTRAVIYSFRLFHAMMRSSCDA